MGAMQWLYRISTFLSFSYRPSDCGDGNRPFSCVGHVNSEMLLKWCSVAHDYLHQSDADSQPEFFNSLCKVQSGNGCGNRSDSRKP